MTKILINGNGILSKLGFEFFYLRYEKVESKIIVYNNKTGNYNQTSKREVINQLTLEFRKHIEYFRDYILKKAQKLNKELTKKDITNKVVFDNVYKWFNDEMKIIDQVGYKPIRELQYEFEDKIHFNTYKMSSFLKNFKISKDIKRFENIHKLILHLVNYDVKSYEYFFNFLAHIIQNPEDKLPIAFVFMGTQGTGKGQLYECVLKPLFESNIKIVTLNDLQKTASNEWVFGKLLIICEEIMNNDNKQEIPQVIKTYISNPTISIQRMHKASIDVQNFAHFIMFSNKANPIQLEDWDRRYNVFKQLRKIDREIIINLRKNHTEELNNFTNSLLNWKIDKHMLLNPMSNQARQELIDINKDTIQQFLDFIMEIDKPRFEDKIKALNKNIKIDRNSYNQIIISSKDFYLAYQFYCQDSGIKNPFTHNRFTSQLKFKGWEKSVQRLDNVSTNVFIIPEEYHLGSNITFDKNDIEEMTIDLSEEVK